MQVRAATTADVPSIAEVHVQAWHETYTGLIPQEVLDGMSVPKRVRAWTQILADADAATDGQSLWVADDDGRVVGFSHSAPSRFAKHPQTGEITSIYLLREYHGRGVGKLLFDRAIESLRVAGHGGFVVRVLTTNPTFGFYAAQGGTPLEEYDEVRGDARLPHVVMGFNIN